MDRDYEVGNVVSVKAYELILRENMELREKIRQLEGMKGIRWKEEQKEAPDSWAGGKGKVT